MIRSWVLVVSNLMVSLVSKTIARPTYYSHATLKNQVRLLVDHPIKPLAPQLLLKPANFFPFKRCRLTLEVAWYISCIITVGITRVSNPFHFPYFISYNVNIQWIATDCSNGVCDISSLIAVIQLFTPYSSEFHRLAFYLLLLMSYHPYYRDCWHRFGRYL